MIPKVWNQNRKWIWQSSDGPKSSDNGSTKQKTKCSPKRWSGITEVTATSCYVMMDVNTASNSEVKTSELTADGGLQYRSEILLLGHPMGHDPKHKVFSSDVVQTPDVLRLYFRNICRGRRSLWPRAGCLLWQLFRLHFCTVERRVYERLLLTHNALWPLFTSSLDILTDRTAGRGETGAQETNQTHGEGTRWGFFSPVCFTLCLERSFFFWSAHISNNIFSWLCCSPSVLSNLASSNHCRCELFAHLSQANTTDYSLKW